MSVAQHSEYLASKVVTAPPHRLHLMLIEGAVRFGRQARTALENGDQAAADPALLRVIDIVGEMLAGVRTNQGEVNTRLASLYAFLLGRLAEAKMDQDLKKLDEALGLLEYERETWQMLVARHESGNESSQSESKKSRTTPESVGVAPLRIHRPGDDGVSSFSLEA